MSAVNKNTIRSRFLSLPKGKNLLRTVFLAVAAAYGLKEGLPYALPSRALTEGEDTLLQSIFKGALTTQKMGLHTSRLMDVKQNMQGALAEAAGNKIIFESSQYSPDFSKAGDMMKYVFVHESTHVWQHQNCVASLLGGVLSNFFSRASGAKTVDQIYDYDLSGKKEFKDFNIEQQANIIADYAVLVPQGKMPFGTGDTQPSKEDYERVLALFLKNPSAKALCSRVG